MHRTFISSKFINSALLIKILLIRVLSIKALLSIVLYRQEYYFSYDYHSILKT